MKCEADRTEGFASIPDPDATKIELWQLSRNS